MLGIGMTAAVNREELERIASVPPGTRSTVYISPDYTEIQGILDPVMNLSCLVPDPIPVEPTPSPTPAPTPRPTPVPTPTPVPSGRILLLETYIVNICKYLVFWGGIFKKYMACYTAEMVFLLASSIHLITRRLPLF